MQKIQEFHFSHRNRDDIAYHYGIMPEALSRRPTKTFATVAYFGGHIEYGDTNDCAGSNLIRCMDRLPKALGLKKSVKRSRLQ